ncbi:MAG: bifunctional precorrin-2 dehydrogenase/sirohydrochlorin ferrochelatase [Desertimonas sp.]
MTELDPPTFGYPVVLDLRDVAVLVVGAGAVAARKVAGLARAGARVRVVASDVPTDFDRTVVTEVRERPYRPDDLDGVRLVITVTGDAGVDAAVAADADARGIWVNAADQPADCSFILPAIARRGRLSIAISTDGSSPALARRLRDRSGELLTDDVVTLAAELAERRREVRATGGSTEDVDWSTLIDAVIAPPGS